MILFQSMDRHTKVQVRFEDKNVWLSQKATIRNFRIVQTEGKREVTRTVDHFNLEAILAVGYRERSSRGTQFRQWASHGKTAAEVIKSRADATKKNMGLTNWKNSPDGPIRKSDVAIAKNYLKEEELQALNRVLSAKTIL
jgi:hypothetical protein